MLHRPTKFDVDRLLGHSSPTQARELTIPHGFFFKFSTLVDNIEAKKACEFETLTQFHFRIAKSEI